MTAPSGSAPGDLTDDAVLGGRLRLWQPVAGFRAGTDAVLLAAACPALAGDRVLDLGCGVGAAALGLGVRVADLALAGLERQPAYADLARANARRNGQAFEVHAGDVRAVPAALRRDFDQVIANPPYWGPGTAAADGGRDAALRGDTPLSDWVGCARRRLRPAGWLTLILGADRLAEALAALSGGFGAVAILPVAPRDGRAAGRVLIRARKGARAPLRLLAPLVLHAAPRHAGDREDLTSEASAILRDAVAISRFDAG
jgi:tRNA1(Val) A37 N6-methylase TrmN6